MRVQLDPARRAGLLYLAVAVLGGFAHFVVRGTIHRPGDAARTTVGVQAHDTLLRVGLIADLAQATIFVLLAMTLHRLLASVGPDVARAMVVFAAMATSIICLNMTFQYAALATGTNPIYADAIGRPEADALVLLAFDVHRHGYLIAQIFFGLWLLPLGHLVRRSRRFPKLLGPVLIVGGATYVTGTLIEFMFPSIGEPTATAIYLPSTIAEVWMIGTLLHSGGWSGGQRLATASPHTYRQPPALHEPNR